MLEHACHRVSGLVLHYLVGRADFVTVAIVRKKRSLRRFPLYFTTGSIAHPFREGSLQKALPGNDYNPEEIDISNQLNLLNV